MNLEDKIKKDNFMNKKANNLIESENGKLMSPEELFIYNEEQNLQSEIDDLEEGKLFVLNTLRQEENIESEKLNYVLDKLSAAEIEVVTDKEEFDRILESQTILQKMTDDLSEFDRLAVKLEEEKNKTENIENKKESLENEKEELAYSNYKELVEFIKKTEKYIPAGKFSLTDYFSSITNKIPLVLDNDGKPAFCIANKIHTYDNNSSLVIIHESNSMGINSIDLDNYNELQKYVPFNSKYKECRLLDSSLLNSYKENLRIFLEQKITKEQQNQQRLINEVGNIKTDLLKASLDNETIEADFARLDNSLRFNANFEINSKNLSDEVSIFPGSTGKSGLGIRHIIEERFKKDNLTKDEITALCGLILDTVRTGEITKNSKNRCELSKNGIIAIVRKDFDNVRQNWILTGYHYTGEDTEKNREATEAIKTVIAKYSNSDGYSYFRSQVGAVIASLDSNITQTLNKSSPQQMVQNGSTYGFAYEGKIYLKSDIMNSEVAVHEYTHLWDNYTQKTNPQLWEKGKSILKDTYYWNEVKSDPNYADIADNDDLVLSEIHSRICGKMADAVLTKIAEKDGKITKDKVIDWDDETWNYIYKSLHISVSHKLDKTSDTFTDLKIFSSNVIFSPQI